VQLGDLRIGGLSEIRFPINTYFKGAFFVDAGNVWSMFYDDKRPGSQISKDWYKQVAFATGFGLRMDLDYFVIRVDIGVPIKNPALPVGAQWIWQPRKGYYDELEATFGADYAKYSPIPFVPQLHFGIGYPF
jgi:outer membrane protein assembly factor BamA